MSIKISELATKLNIPVKDLRAKVQDMHLGVSPRANVFRDELAEEIVRRLTPDAVTADPAAAKVKEKVAVVKTEPVKAGLAAPLAKEPIVSKESPETLAEAVVEPPTEPVVALPTVEIPDTVMVGELASLMNLPVATVIKELMKNGVLANINERIDFDTAGIIGQDLGFTMVLKAETHSDAVETGLSDLTKYDPKDLAPRPPIVTVMGHVDHGKTSILDKIRATNVVSSESGGITQHMGAYQAKKNGRLITFIDTPGHQAFSAMRAHGAKLTDIAVLVVAADDGVKPQTIEAINHAKAVGVPIIVAMNKIDKPGANLDKVKKELADFNLIPEEWGGKTIMVPTSAKTGEGIETLLEMILLVADVADMKAYKKGLAQGVVIEAHLSKRVGPVATVLITQGCLQVKDHVVVGQTDGVVRAMVDYTGERMTKAFPSDPVRLAGLDRVPEFGDSLFAVGSAKEAKQIVLERKKRISSKGVGLKSISMAELSQAVREGQIKELPVVLKTDVQGSLEAIRSSLAAIHNDEVRVNILHEGAGAVSESDILLAASARGIVLSFRAKIEPNALKMAKKMGVTVTSYDVIYRLLEDITAALEGLLEPEIVDVKVGRAKVLRVFTHGKKSRIIGVSVTKGQAEKGSRVIVFRKDVKVGEGKVEEIRRGTDTVDKVSENNECGISLSGQFKVEEGDNFEFWQTQTVVRKLTKI